MIDFAKGITLSEKMIAFSNVHPPIVKVYNTFIRENWLYHVLPRLKLQNYKYHYQMLKSVYKQQFPWQYVKEGQTVIQVSAAKSLIPMGVSQGLILSALVGPKGRVFVIEPDPGNVCVLKAYLITQGIKNVIVIEKGVWKETGKMDFSIRQDFSSWNRIHETISPDAYNTYQHKLQTVKVDVDTLDNIIREHGIDDVSFVNMTINGSEYNALLGMSETIKKDVIVSFPIQNVLTMQSPILRKLEESGFHVLLKHAPVATHQKQFIVACAVRMAKQEILNNGFEEVDVSLTKKDERDFIKIVPVAGGDKYDDWIFRKQVRWF